MIDYSSRNIMNISKETNFIKDNIEKVMRLVDVLELLFSSRIKDKIVLKGGTAINLIYREFPRLSVDIDLDYIGTSKDEMEFDKEEIRRFLFDFLSKKGYDLSLQSKRYYALDSFQFNYINNAGNKDNIKIEINYLDRNHILPIRKMKIEKAYIKSDILIPTLDVSELYGSKIAALIDRCKVRDVYDVYGMIIDGTISDKTILRKCVVFYNCVGGEANINEISLDILDEITNNDIKRKLIPMLRKSENFNKDVAIPVIKEFLTRLLQLTDKEKDFVKKFKEREYLPELLFDDNEIVNRIVNHPMAKWKVDKSK